MAADILALIGKAKPSLPKGGEDSSTSMGGGTEAEYAREAFAALKDDDVDGFVAAFTGAVKACVENAKSGGYDDEEV